MIEKPMKEKILHRLRQVEEEHNVRIIYACESGSRAWGFASPDSDYDVRFIYIHNEDWYLSFDLESAQRDTVECPIIDELDCSGWDIRKAMYLLTSSNMALLEWLNSPIKYVDVGAFAEAMRYISLRTLNKTAMCYHYRCIASNNATKHLFNSEVKLKVYFYVLRCLLAIRYLEEKGTQPPVEFTKLLHSVCPEALVPIIENLIANKRETIEIGRGAKIPQINDFIVSELNRHNKAFPQQPDKDILEIESIRSELNTLFRKIVRGG